MKPTIGRIVHFTFDEVRRAQIDTHQAGVMAELGQGTTVPATIVAVWSDKCVNLRVHPDGPGPDLWETSVVLKDEHTADGSYWEWPPRV